MSLVALDAEAEECEALRAAEKLGGASAARDFVAALPCTGCYTGEPHACPNAIREPVTHEVSDVDVRDRLRRLEVQFSALVRDEVMEVNPARECKTPRIDHAPKTPWLNEEQVRQLLSVPAKTWIDRRDRLAVVLLFGLGWRRAEVARMQVEDFKNGTVTGQVKGGKKLTVGVPVWVQDAIEGWQKFAKVKAGPLLRAFEGSEEGLTGDMVYNAVKRTGLRAGLPRELVTPHALRRSNITLGGKRGVDLKKRQQAVGHSSQLTTERYDKAREAAENAPGDVFADLAGGGR